MVSMDFFLKHPPITPTTNHFFIINEKKEKIFYFFLFSDHAGTLTPMIATDPTITNIKINEIIIN